MSRSRIWPGGSRHTCLGAGLTVATAESCTGGLVAHGITSIPGSSGYFLGAIVSYADRVKVDALGVPPDVLATHGAVSAQVALAMASGIRDRLATDLGVGITGVAGPDGGSDEKPVGLVYVGGERPTRDGRAPVPLGGRSRGEHRGKRRRGPAVPRGARRRPRGSGDARRMTRTHEDIARGLAAPRDAVPIAPGTRIHVVGVGGTASAGAALHAAAVGAAVTACDSGGPDPVTGAVLAAGIPIDWRHDAAHVRGHDGRPVIDRLAVTKAITSVQPDHPELVAARDVGIVPESVQQIVADAAATGGRRLIGVTGTHGKSTTSGWLLHLLVGAGRDPSGFVGANLPASIVGPQRGVARFGSGPDFVVEADEYAGNFDPYRPDIAVLVSAEWDHPDVFLDETEVVEAFAEWIAHGRPGGDRTLVANVGRPRRPARHRRARGMGRAADRGAPHRRAPAR